MNMDVELTNLQWLSPSHATFQLHIASHFDSVGCVAYCSETVLNTVERMKRKWRKSTMLLLQFNSTELTNRNSRSAVHS